MAALFLALAMFGGGCSSSQPQASTSPIAANPSTLPFAPPVTPGQGEAFVGFWAGADALSAQATYFEVLPLADGYEVSVNGARLQPVPLKDGRLVLQTLKNTPVDGGALVRAGYELAWEDGHCVLLSKPGAEIPVQREPLKRLSRAAYVKGVRSVADQTTRRNLNVLAVAVSVWSDRSKHGPPSPSQLRPGSTFDRWLTKISGPGAWTWPTNPFSGKPHHSGTHPGDFTYVVAGRHWSMTGHLSDGRSFNAEQP